MPQSLKALLLSTLDAAKAYADTRLASIASRVGAVERKLLEAPAPERGPAGDRGPAGPRGAQGQVGARGERGQRGDRGATGAPGSKGIDGSPGAQGPQGESGLQGQSGSSGEPGPRGLPGNPGAPGPEGPQGAQGAAGAEGAQGAAGNEGEKGERGQSGERGEPGASAYDIALRNGFEGNEVEFLASLRGPAGERGPEGAQGAKGLDGAAGRDGAAGKDGAPGSIGPQGERGATGVAGLEGAVGAKGEAGPQGISGAMGPQGKDGLDGRDAVHIPIIDFVDEARSYAKGTVAAHRGGMLLAVRATSPLRENSLAEAGWLVICNGDYEELITVEEDMRTFTLRKVKTNGTVIERKHKFPALLDKGVWKSGAEYEWGDGVTFDGSFWIAQKTTTARPGTSTDWRLAVKKGRDGKPGGDKPTPSREPIRLAGD